LFFAFVSPEIALEAFWLFIDTLIQCRKVWAEAATIVQHVVYIHVCTMYSVQ
jgi:hypothetical protein